MITKIVLTIITGFLFILSIYLIITGKKISGTHLNASGWGWLSNSFSGYLLLLVAVGFLVALIFVFKGKKIEP